jgi:hypothetical protein
MYSVSSPIRRWPTRGTTDQNRGCGPLVQVPFRVVWHRVWRCMGRGPCCLAVQPRRRRLQERDRLSLRGAHESSGGPVPAGRGACWCTSWNSSVLLPTSRGSTRPCMDIFGGSGGRDRGYCVPPAVSPGVVSCLLIEQGLPRSERRHLPTHQSTRRREAASVRRLRCAVGHPSSKSFELPAVAREDNGLRWRRSRPIWTGQSAALECARQRCIRFTSSPHCLDCGKWRLVGHSESKGGSRRIASKRFARVVCTPRSPGLRSMSVCTLCSDRFSPVESSRRTSVGKLQPSVGDLVRDVPLEHLRRGWCIGQPLPRDQAAA